MNEYEIKDTLFELNRRLIEEKVYNYLPDKKNKYYFTRNELHYLLRTLQDLCTLSSMIDTDVVIDT